MIVKHNFLIMQNFKYSKNKIILEVANSRETPKSKNGSIKISIIFLSHISWLGEFKGTQAWNFPFDPLCRNRILTVPRASNTRFLKIVFDSAEIFDFKTFPRMPSMDCTCKNCSHFTAGWACVPRMPSTRWNRFRACSGCHKTASAHA
jgi:hypothetical protein